MTRRPLWDRRRGLLAAALAVVVTNAAVFAHVVWNRSGGPTARLELTDREVRLPRYDLSPFADDEDTGIALHLDVQDTGPDWLDREKLGELGFDVTVDPEVPRALIHYRNVPPRDAWIVLEHDGEAWRRRLADRREWLDELRRELARSEATTTAVRSGEVSLAEERVEASRLFAVDAGLDRAALRARYGETSRFAVVPGTVRLRHVRHVEDEPDHLEGGLELAVARIQVPLRLRRPAERAIATRGRLWRERNERRSRTEVDVPDPIPPVLRAEVAFGRLGEPWLLSVEALPVEAPASDSQTESAMPDGIDGERGGG